MYCLGCEYHQGRTVPRDDDRAIELFRRVAYEGEACQRRGAAFSNLGTILNERGDLTGAEEAYRNAIVWDPGIISGHHNLGLLKQNRGDIDGALASFRAAVKADPRFAQGSVNIGAILMDKHDVDAAETSFRAAMTVNPSLYQAHQGLGVCSINRANDAGKANEPVRALALWEKAAKHLSDAAARGDPDVGSLLDRVERKIVRAREATKSNGKTGS